MATRPLSPDQLRHACPPDLLDFESTEQLEPLAGMLGQERALEAIDFGVHMPDADFNLFVLGPPGVGKHRFLRAFLAERAQQQPVPPDWCYVENFDDPQHPRALQLPAGTGQRLRQDMRAFLEDLLLALPAAFQSEAYRTRQQEIEDEFGHRQEQAFHRLDDEARAQGIAILPTPSGYTLVPMRDGKLLEPEQYEQLPAEEKQRIEARIDTLREKLKELLREVPGWQREMNQRLKALQREVTELTVNQLIGWLQERYADIEVVRDYVESVRRDVIDNVDTLYAAVENVERENVRKLVDDFVQYSVNVLVDNGALQGAPVVYEDNPTYQNLIGRVEHVAEMGTLLTNFTLIRPGALHRANGGYLILDARKLLANYYAWEGLKRALSAREVRIESLERITGFVSTITLEPENMPLQVKVVLVGEPPLYYLLKALDPDFGLLFKVAADFAWDMPRDAAAVQAYARFIATLQRRYGLPPVRRDAVARLIEHASRMAEDRDRLSLAIDAVADLLREAAFHARRAGSAHIERSHVQQAIDAARRRQDQYRERLQEQILRDIQHVETDGERVAQVNGLSVIELGDYAFGRPSRITATARLGEGKLIDIERESHLGGHIHSKGVLILSAYLASRYAREQPLPLAASLVFEQSYGRVDGDSASAAELCALLSAIGDLPLAQHLAVTGSVDQHGRLQAIGGVNEKIEGFFELCRARGLDGRHGVVIPAANQAHLMLRDDVVQAVADGRFHIHVAEHVEEVMSLLCGLPAGERDADGRYPADSFNGRIQRRVAEWLALRRKYARDAHHDSQGAD